MTVIAKTEKHRRIAEALDRFSAVAFACESVDKLAQGLLQIFVDVARVEHAVLRLRDHDRLRSRAAVGLEEELAAGFSIPLAQAFPIAGEHERDVPVLSRAAVDDGCGSDAIRKSGLRALYCLALLHDDALLGVVYLAANEAREFSDDEKQLLSVLASRSAAALARQLERDGLQEGIRARDDMLGIVAHDLRNPLNVISIGANILLSRLPDSAARRPAERILRGAQRANRLIQSLLEINAIEGGRFSIETRKVETADTILAALASQESLTADASIIIATDLSPGLPPIQADEERILEVLENLVGNAIKFTSPGGSVTVGAAARENEVLFWVKDSGSGISAEELPHLFDRFWQGRKKNRRGTGLGLTICKAIVEAHGGRIWPETIPGVGTTLFFTIPAVARGPKAGNLRVANILLVDDRPENLISLRAVLERPDYRLLTATSGEEALRLALRETFAVALIDIAMPRMNGLEVAAHLKDLERSRDIPIIFITAFGDDPQEIHRAYSAGGVDYLVKPLDADIVRKKVAVFVDLSRRRQASEPLVDDPNSDR